MALIRRCKVCRKEGKPYNIPGHKECGHKEAIWAISYVVNRKRIWKNIGPRKKDAIERLEEIKLQIRTIGSTRAVKPILFSEMSKKWFQFQKNYGTKPSSLSTYETVLKRYLNPYFGKNLLTEMTPDDIEVFKNQICKTISTRTCNHILNRLSSIFGYARELGFLINNPIDRVRKFKNIRYEARTLTEQEITGLIENSAEPYRTLFLVAIYTGLRSGEVLGLQWQDIDFEKNLIHVRRTLWAGRKDGPGMDGKHWWCFTSPKSTNSKRDVLMIPALRDALLEHKKRLISNSLNLLFCTKSGQPISRGWLIQRHFHPALKAVGVTGVRFHDLRHSFATILLNRGINLPFVSKQLGHASVNVTVDIYHHILPSQIADQRDIIQNILAPTLANRRLIEQPQSSK